MNKFNYDDILDYKIKGTFIFISAFIILLILIYILCSQDMYSSFEFTGISSNNEIVASIPYENVGILTSNEILYIDENDYDYEILLLEELFLNGDDYYQTIVLSVQADIMENEVLVFKILYDKEKVIKKIINLIF